MPDNSIWHAQDQIGAYDIQNSRYQFRQTTSQITVYDLQYVRLLYNTYKTSYNCVGQSKCQITVETVDIIVS